MPIADTIWDRLKDAIVALSPNAQSGIPGLRIAPYDSGITTLGDGLRNDLARPLTGDQGNQVYLPVQNYILSATNWDRERGNYEETALVSAARTASADSITYSISANYVR